MEGRRVALLVATDRYQDTGLSRLAAPAGDARKLAAVLGDSAIAGFEVMRLYNRPNAEVGKAIGNFYRNRKRDDLTLLYFTGHGIKDDYGQLYLAMTDTDRDNLPFTGLRGEQIRMAMEGCRSRQNVLVLDCCYAGAFPGGSGVKGDTAVHALEQLSGRGSVVLTSSDATQYSFEGDQLTETGATSPGSGPSSLFTRFLVEGLSTGRADLDGDGNITLDELYSYVHDRVTEEQPQQRPKKKEDVEGRILFAWNIHWTLPPHISNALSSPYAVAKLTALEELRGRYNSGNTIVQQRILETVRELAEDDSKQVSNAAHQFLSAVIEAEEKARREAEEKARQEAEAKARQEAEAKARQEAIHGEAVTTSQVGEDAIITAPTVASAAEAPKHTPGAEAAEHQVAADGEAPTGSKESEVSKRRKRTILKRTRKSPPTAPATPDATKLPNEPVELPPAKRRKRLSRRALIVIGSASILALILIIRIIVIIISGPALNSLLLPTAGTIFRDNFSSEVYGWLPVASGKGSGAYYGNGVYHTYAAAGGSVLSSPKKASNVYPSAPSNILVGVDARVLPGPARLIYSYYVACRTSGPNGYEFTVLGTGHNVIITIEKLSTNGSSPKFLTNAAPTINPNSDNLLQAQCTNVQGGRGVQLVFSVNGTAVAAATDTHNPLRTGSVGVGMLNFNDTPVHVDFNNFVVKQVDGTGG